MASRHYSPAPAGSLIEGLDNPMILAFAKAGRKVLDFFDEGTEIEFPGSIVASPEDDMLRVFEDSTEYQYHVAVLNGARP